MSFLAPLYLALAVGAAVPLLVHLLRRRAGARVEFPAVRYLVRAEQEHSRRSRLHNLLLLLLRMLAVLLIAVAAARPVGRVGGTGHAPTAVAIVLDNSLSTSAVSGGRRTFDDLRAAARRVADEATAADRVWLVTADSAVAGSSRAAVLAALDRAEPLRGAGSPAGALARAAALVRTAGLPNAHVVLLTDAQATTWRRLPQLGGMAVSVYAPGGSPPANAAVIGATPRPPRWTPGGELAMRFVGAPASAAYRVSLGDATLARGTVPPAGESGYSEASVRAAPAARGWTAGTVSLPPDELRQDDVRHFALWLGPPPRLYADTNVGPFARTAVDALVQSGRAIRGSDIAVAAADVPVRLPALLTAPVDPVRLGAANRSLERAGIGWRFGAVRTGAQTVTGTGELSGAAGRVIARRRYALLAQPGVIADTLARAGGEPWIVSGPSYVVVASPLVPEATTLPVQAAFLPWLAGVVAERLAGAGARMLESAPGATYLVPDAVDAIGADPPGTMPRTALRPGERRLAPREPGVYWFERAGARVGALVVNVEAEESVLQRISAQELTRRIAPSAAAADGAALASAAFRTGGAGRPLGAVFLVAALVALACETALVRVRQRAA